MKFYLVEGRYVATQAAAGKHPFTAVDIPTDQKGLMALLNGMLDELAKTHDTAGLAASALIMACEEPEPDTVRERQRQDITIEEAIAESDYPRALALAHHIHHRLMEHGRAIGAGQ